ncbi:MAG TPA: aldehyde dehydrogenase family protein [Candidatus Baltobacteraceae bacterium]|nr:aldehyde dehydrogenase family protein [Candidatus Baltobacteraceae bacterium]
MEVRSGPLPLTVGDLDRAVDALHASADAWARLGIAGKIRHLRLMRARTVEVAAQWVSIAAQAKGIDGTQLAGEEWLAGPYPLLTALDRLIATLGEIANAGAPAFPDGAVRTRADGQVVVDVFPGTRDERLLMNGVRAEVWMQPDVTEETLRERTAAFYRQTRPDGIVTLVLGAGNIASIPPLDALTALYAHGSTVLLKLNPVNAYLEPVFARIFASLVDEDAMRIVEGGSDVGAYLVAHPGIDAIHLTGGEATYDAIVFGGGADALARKRADDPVVRKPVSSELGNVTPVIVVPGPWSERDLRFQAAHVATQKLHNAGANCIAAQVLVTPAAWDRTPAFLDAVRAALVAAPRRPTYYPGSAHRVHELAAAHPHAERLDIPLDGVYRTVIPNLDARDRDEPLFRTEAFGPVLGQTSLPGADAAAFLRHAVAFCNETLYGTLGASILIHPRTRAELGSALEDAIAALRYGCVAVNAWPGVGFSLAGASWGAFPGNTVANVGSGIGVVHNAYLFDAPEKTVVHAPFAPFPRSLRDGERTLLPTPPWFVSHRRAERVGRNLFAFTARPSTTRLLSTVADAMRA